MINSLEPNPQRGSVLLHAPDSGVSGSGGKTVDRGKEGVFIPLVCNEAMTGQAPVTNDVGFGSVPTKF